MSIAYQCVICGEPVQQKTWSHDCIPFMREKIARLERENADLQANVELRKDAERYRWLKAHHLQTGPDSWIRTGDDLEEAIDAAMKDGA